MYDVFISYNRSDNDRHHVKRLSSDLTAMGFKVFLDDEDSHKLNGSTLDKTLEEKLLNCRVVAICVGAMGLGPSQEHEIAYVKKISETSLDGHEEANNGLPVPIPVTLGFTTRDELSDDGLAGWLKSMLVHNFPSSAPDDLGIVSKIEEMVPLPNGESDKQDEPKKEPEISELEGQIEEFAADAVEDGMAIFLGTHWPERDEIGFFNSDDLSRHINKLVGVGTDEVVSIEQAVAASGIATPNKVRLVKQLKRARQKLDKEYALRAPPVLSEVARVLTHFQVKTGKSYIKSKRPIVVFSTSPDILLERELVWHGVSFLRVAVTPGKEYRESMIFVENQRANAKIRQIRSELPEIVRSNLQEHFNARGLEFQIDEFDSTRLARGEDDQARRYNTATSLLGDSVNRKLIWQQIEIARIIREACEASHLCVRFDKPSALVCDAAANISDWCVENSVPIIVKLYGCVNEEVDEVGFSMEQITKATQNSWWIPDQFLTKILKCPIVFAGFRSVGLDFQNLLFGHLGQDRHPWPSRSRFFIPVERPRTDDNGTDFRNFDIALSEAHNFSRLEIKVLKKIDAWGFFYQLNSCSLCDPI